ncbi:MAG TPA: hypothetical protein DEV93_12670, partial [Chloroflexi bacterium]|nr:hypothetical protein [Chloroflexota bacterium]
MWFPLDNLGIAGNIWVTVDDIRKGSHRRALSPRELQVLGLAAAGGTLQEIADALHVSPKTVS